MNHSARAINYVLLYPFRFFLYFFISFTSVYGIGSYIFLKYYSEQDNIIQNINLILLLGIIAGLLQLIGYIVYILHEDIDPNPVTWFMFAYGTAILTLLEWDSHATGPELILPIVCAVFAIVVSYRCWKTARKKDSTRWWPEDWWPQDKFDRLSFISDMLITVGYIGIWVMIVFGNLTAEGKEMYVLLFLFMSNLSTFRAFYPILRTTYQNHYREAAAPWFIWAVAYFTLAVVTYMTHGEFWHALMFYPVSNAILHALVGIFSLK
jgi:hypothetical protein